MNKSHLKFFAAAVTLGVAAFGSTSSYAFTVTCPTPNNPTAPLNGCDLPGTKPGSAPYFTNTITADSKTKFDKDGTVKKFDIKATQIKDAAATFVLPDGTVFDIEKAKFKFKAKFIDETTVEGNLTISGMIDGEKFDVKADLAGPTDGITPPYGTGDGMLWGFDTTNIQCSDSITAIIQAGGGSGCTLSEVVYLNLLSSIGPDENHKHTKISSAGYAVTSVPVPAAVWLLGSGLLGLIGVARRSNSKA